MKLFFCLALFSLSSAEPLFRLPLHRNKSVRHQLEQVGTPIEEVLRSKKSDDSAPFPEPHSTNQDVHNGNEQDRGIGFSVSGSCNTSPVNGAYNVNNAGSGHCYITYGDCSSSTSNVPGIANSDRFWINDVNNQGSGVTTITYCSSSTSSRPNDGRPLINNVLSGGSGKIYIKHLCGASPSMDGRKMMNDIQRDGSSEVYIEYRSCCPSFSDVPRASYSCGKMFNNIRGGGSGILDIKYYDCGGLASSVPRRSNNCGILGNSIHNEGSGHVYITYWNCGGLLSSVPSNSYGGELVNKVYSGGSGSVNVNYGRCSTTASSARNNTNIAAKLDKMLANVMSQAALENEETHRLTFKHTREGKSVKKESVPDAAVAAPGCQKKQKDEEGVPTKKQLQRE